MVDFRWLSPWFSDGSLTTIAIQREELALIATLPTPSSHSYKTRNYKFNKRSEFMHYMKIKRVIALVVLLSVVGLAPASIPVHTGERPQPFAGLAIPSLRQRCRYRREIE